MASVKRRDIEVEVLRIVSILGIAVFHTFLPWINALFHNMDDGVGIGVSGMTTSFTALFLLALIALLGSFGNNVFFMISGFFIMPSLEKDSRTPGYWKRQTRKTLRRIAVIVASVAIIGALCWLLSLVLPMDYFSTGVVGRFTMGLEFIWLYAIIVAFAPVFAWLAVRIETWANMVAILFVTVMGLNLYVASLTKSPNQAGFSTGASCSPAQPTSSPSSSPASLLTRGAPSVTSPASSSLAFSSSLSSSWQASRFLVIGQ